MAEKWSELTGVVQAGGESRRMGQDKALMTFLGEPLILRPVRRLAALTGQIFIITNRPENYSFTGYPIFQDLIPDTGALGGLFTALSTSTTAIVATVACDMPFVNLALLRKQLELLEEDATLAFVIPESAHGVEPMHTVYRRELCLPEVSAAITRGERRMISWHDRVRSVILPRMEVLELDPLEAAFLNLNTPEEFFEAERLAKANPTL